MLEAAGLSLPGAVPAAGLRLLEEGPAEKAAEGAASTATEEEPVATGAKAAAGEKPVETMAMDAGASNETGEGAKKEGGAAEEEEEEEFTPVDVGCGWMLLGSVAMTMVLFYLVNWKDDDIRRYSWGIISTTISIFTAVLIFSGVNDLYMAWLVNPLLGHRHGLYDFDRAALGFLLFGAFLVLLHTVVGFFSGAWKLNRTTVGRLVYKPVELPEAVWVIADPLRADYGTALDESEVRNHTGEKSIAFKDNMEVFVRKKHMAREARERRTKCWATLFAHMAGFAAINAGGDVQHVMIFKSSPLTSLGSVAITAVLFATQCSASVWSSHPAGCVVESIAPLKDCSAMAITVVSSGFVSVDGLDRARLVLLTYVSAIFRPPDSDEALEPYMPVTNHFICRITHLLGGLRRWQSAYLSWCAELCREEAEEAENDIFSLEPSLAVSFLLVQVIRFSVTGVLPGKLGDEGGEFRPVASQVLALYGVGVGFAVLTGLITYFAGHKGKIAELAQGTTAMGFAWCFLWATRWAALGWSVLEDASAGPATMEGRILIALVLSVAAIGVIFLLDTIEDLGSDNPRISKIIQNIINSLSILVGFTWEHCFDGGVEAVASTTFHPVLMKIIFTFLSALALILAIPMIVINGYDHSGLLAWPPAMKHGRVTSVDDHQVRTFFHHVEQALKSMEHIKPTVRIVKTGTGKVIIPAWRRYILVKVRGLTKLSGGYFLELLLRCLEIPLWLKPSWELIRQVLILADFQKERREATKERAWNRELVCWTRVAKKVPVAMAGGLAEPKQTVQRGEGVLLIELALRGGSKITMSSVLAPDSALAGQEEYPLANQSVRACNLETRLANRDNKKVFKYITQTHASTELRDNARLCVKWTLCSITVLSWVIIGAVKFQRIVTRLAGRGFFAGPRGPRLALSREPEGLFEHDVTAEHFAKMAARKGIHVADPAGTMKRMYETFIGKRVEPEESQQVPTKDSDPQEEVKDPKTKKKKKKDKKKHGSSTSSSSSSSSSNKKQLGCKCMSSAIPKVMICGAVVLHESSCYSDHKGERQQTPGWCL
ncbi:unnamed protein product [Polarella glacialis]|uniref:Uncharacterized protein n=1 Tax=Polarella glacialis TaxID=89957 RepID=A0A813GUZ3_POLGL|nr:unnamed protein product [Polarella glacialis]